jgi:hypothetical protein
VTANDGPNIKKCSSHTGHSSTIIKFDDVLIINPTTSMDDDAGKIRAAAVRNEEMNSIIVHLAQAMNVTGRCECQRGKRITQTSGDHQLGPTHGPGR